ncbi:MAG: bifunctional chorismate mutase/prephenate dehydratase [Ruminococcaceae bacterium]|nr:bifunctional chorismate mutase/prephenate dehydratase [Oscillospiraceae bacterium]
MTELDIARKIINATDQEIAKLFEQRMDAVRMVANYKREHGIPVDDLGREAEIIAKNSQAVASDDYRSYYVDFLRSTIDISKKFQHRLLDGMRVAYSGVVGAFANIAAEKIFPDAICVGYPDFAAAYNAALSGECDCALLPVENSFNGDVGKVLDLAFFGELYINGVYEAEIIQNLLASKGTTIGDIEQVVSHPQALGQCAQYIEKHGFEPVEAVNTAVAAKMVAESGRQNLAAIGSEEAAKKFGLEILESRINESGTNTTRFAVFSRNHRDFAANDKHFIMLFTVKNTAGSLGRAVSVIGEHGFNLRALKSRPTKDLSWDYYFYVEGEGNLGTFEGKAMLADLNACCNSVKIIATYEKEIKI